MQPEEIVQLLPEVFRRTVPTKSTARQGSVLWALLDVMSTLQTPDEIILEILHSYFDPDQIPEAKVREFLPFLARWVDLDWVLPASGEYEAGLHCLHDLILSAPRLASLRGTREGLKQFLETATGLREYYIIDDSELRGTREDLKHFLETAPGPRKYPANKDFDQPRSFTISIYCPKGAELLKPLVRRIADAEKPAYVRCNLIFPLSQPATPTGSSHPKGSAAIDEQNQEGYDG